MKTSKKKVKVHFYITGQSNKSNPLETPDMFLRLWQNKFSTENSEVLFVERSTNSDAPKRNLALLISEYDSDAKFYFGYVGIMRDTMLPSIINKETKLDSKIPLSAHDEVIEKSYFLYYPETDILVFNSNHLGPKVDDLSYILFKTTNCNLIRFEPIWKSSHMKEILESGSSLKRGYLTLALPRNFDSANLNFENQFCEEIIKMMSRTGMTRLKLEFSGRASRKKGVQGYLLNDIKSGFKEFIASRRSGVNLVEKAEAQLVDSTIENLLDQELSCSMDITVVDGYPQQTDIRKTLIHAKLQVSSELKIYQS